MRWRDAADPREQALEKRADLLRFEILDEVGKYQRAAFPMEELDFSHVAACDRQPGDFSIPRIAGSVHERNAIKRYVLFRLLFHAWRQIDRGFGKGRLPLRKSTSNGCG